MLKEDRYVGTTRVNNRGCAYTVLNRVEKQENGTWSYKIHFSKTGKEYIVFANSIRTGTARDFYNPEVCGVGYLGASRGVNSTMEYRVWHAMLGRCYTKSNKDYKTYGAKGAHVCSRWHNFTNFLEDIVKIEGYDYNKFVDRTIVLDKDIKQAGILNKVYSLETCIFITNSENTAERNKRYKHCS